MGRGEHWYEIYGWLNTEQPRRILRTVSIGTDVKEIQEVLQAHFENMKKDWPELKSFTYRKIL